jgi:hypothetical protein
VIEWLAGAGGVAAVASGAIGYAGLRRKGLHRWLWPWIRGAHSRRFRSFDEETHLFLAICDHYEPLRGGVGIERGRARVQQWQDDYPRLFAQFRDAEGKPPQHTFFYPQDEYEPELVDRVASLCRQGYGEVEVHLHHDHDTSDGLRQKLLDFKTTLRNRHGLLATDSRTGDTVYAFIHGNWALDNSRSDGRWCGVNDEIDILRETGCYADFTMPSAPSETQTRTINQLYWAVDDPLRPKSHDTGIQLSFEAPPERGLLMVPGPLTLTRKTSKFGRIMPAIENGNLQHSQPPNLDRLKLWLSCGISPCNEKTWAFVKLYSHGVQEPNQDVMLGSAMVDFHLEIQRICRQYPRFHVHYVTAREMVNIALAKSKKSEGLFDTLRNFRYHLL